MTNLISLTDSIIISDLNYVANEALLASVLWVIPFIVLFILWIVSLKKRDDKSIYKFNVFAIPIISFVFVFGLINSINSYFTIKYYIDSNSWTVVNDKIFDIETARVHSRHSYRTVHYMYLSKYGRIKVDDISFANCSIGDSVYIVIAKDKNGNEQPTRLIYSQKKYIYKHN